MKSAGWSRAKAFGGCFVIALAGEYLYSSFIDPEGKVVSYIGKSAPYWLQSVHRWMPAVLSVRILNSFGLRFEFQRYDANTGFILASMVIEALIWALVLFGLWELLKRVQQHGDRVAAA